MVNDGEPLHFQHSERLRQEEPKFQPSLDNTGTRDSHLKKLKKGLRMLLSMKVLGSIP